VQVFVRVTEGISRPSGKPKLRWKIILIKNQSTYNETLRRVHAFIVRVEKW
jgi:hypothetical protein